MGRRVAVGEVVIGLGGGPRGPDLAVGLLGERVVLLRLVGGGRLGAQGLERGSQAQQTEVPRDHRESEPQRLVGVHEVVLLERLAQRGLLGAHELGAARQHLRGQSGAARLLRLGARSPVL